ncbi:MAG: sensor histidine kinase, partial [Desulfovibrio sp.]|nr:sensor histidine kinase [Desulfovibrio sp.]MCA1986573.1 sensor histidine kinase [Desulfovibrio sp.]
GFSRLLLRKAESGTSQCEQLQAILDGGVRLHEIVLAVSEFTALHVEALRPMHLAPCCQEAVAHVRQEFPDSIRWVVDFPEAPDVILGDPALLALALQALLRNAAEAVLRGNGPGTVRLRLWREAQHHVLDMEDTGPGLADADLPFLFDPFFTTKPVGVGMGLCKAQRIIREHKGTVTLENREDGPGARARVVLPPHDTTA